MEYWRSQPLELRPVITLGWWSREGRTVAIILAGLILPAIGIVLLFIYRWWAGLVAIAGTWTGCHLLRGAIECIRRYIVGRLLSDKAGQRGWNSEKKKAAIGLLVNLLFWLFFLAIISLSLLIGYRFDSVLLGSALCMVLFLLMGYISLKVRAGRPVDRSPILPKTSVGPDTSLKEFPLLYLYFDDFAEMETAWRNDRLEAGMDDRDMRILGYSMNQIMSDSSLFSELYRENLVRLRLNDGTVLSRAGEMAYWDMATGRKQGWDVFREKPEDGKAEYNTPPKLGAGATEYLKKLHNEMEPMVQAIRRRYGIGGCDAAAAEDNRPPKADKLRDDAP